MPLPRSIDIDGRGDLWRDLIALRRAQAQPRAEQRGVTTEWQDTK